MSEYAVAFTAMAIAGLAVLVSLIALRYASRQTKAAEESASSSRLSAEAAAETARIALDAEKNAQHGWQIERVGNDKFALRNTGTLSAHDVQVAGNFDPIGFDIQNPNAMVDIHPGQAAAFWAVTDMEHPGGDVVITWCNQIVQGQADLTPRTHWIEQLPPKPPRGAQPTYAGMRRS